MSVVTPGDPGLQLWAGIECTLNRVGEVYFDQLAWNGHRARLDDLDRFAGLGIRTLRYPVLWESIAPDGFASADWSWIDRQLERLQALGVRPIVGLVHHGSGPRHTSLVDPAFPEKLAEFAYAVACRYPWVDAYTPVNEPLTTARFSGLYGHWYPHGRDETTFARALLTQTRATGLAMAAIRQVNPAARLIQTEDIGKVYSTPLLDYQADYENTRRWLSLDLLTGRMTPRHSLYDYFEWAGIPESELRLAAENPCPPDVIGLNYYITSERFLDERLERYPAHTHGGNGRQAYADVEAVRVCAEGLTGAGALLREAWERYHRPLALTEVHLGATHDEQLRWLVEVWQEAAAQRAAGVDVQAVTVWSLLGAYNWHCLVTHDECYYEPGVFDLRSDPPRPTALAQAVQVLAQGRPFDHPALDTPGWWRRPARLLYPPTPRRDAHAYASGAAPVAPLETAAGPARRPRTSPPRPLVITGSGTLGQAFARLCQARGLDYHLLSRSELDICCTDQIAARLDQLRPWALINAAGYVRVDQAEREPQACFQANADGPHALALECARRGLKLVTFSSDLVFDGSQASPYLEDSPVRPLNVYGRSKVEAEQRVLQALPEALVIRTSAFFGPWDEANFVAQTLSALRAGRQVLAASDLTVSPTYVPDLAQAGLDLLVDGEQGLWHLANGGQVTWDELGRRAAQAAGLSPEEVCPVPASRLGYAARRPAYSALGSRRGRLLPSLDDALARYPWVQAPARPRNS